jgi:hypothetical protein
MIDEFCRCLAKGSSPLARKDRLCLDVGEPSPPSARFALVQAGPLPVLVLALATPPVRHPAGLQGGACNLVPTFGSVQRNGYRNVFSRQGGQW